jgi:hypothetical protein
MTSVVPLSLRRVLWSKDIKSVDAARDRPYIVHQVLAFGTLNDLRELGRLYSSSVIRQTFIHDPIKIYTRSAYEFARKILGISDRDAPVVRYDKALPRYIG